MKLSDSDKLVALAYLYQGKSPREVEELCERVSYAQALRLKKELEQAKEDGVVDSLFQLGDATLETVLEQAKFMLANQLKEVPKEGELLAQVDEEIANLKDDIEATKILKAELAKAATVVAKKIHTIALSSNNSQTVLDLAEALAKMQLSFFKTSNINLGDRPSFEEFLTK